MARPTLGTHPKFFRLAALVGGRAVARGALELIWEAAYASGEPFIGDAATVESLADWRGEPGALAAALVAVGFLDAEEGAHYVHDLEDHAPDYVLKRWERERARQAKGQTLRSQRQAAARASWAARSANGNANGEHLQDVCIATVAPPAPAPAPAQSFPPAGAPDPSAPVHGLQVVQEQSPPIASRAAQLPRIPETFARTRAAILGGSLDWDTPTISPQKLGEFTLALEKRPEAIPDVEPTMRLFWTSVRDGTIPDAQMLADNDTLAFGAWRAKFKNLREQLHGTAPKVAAPAARGSPRDRGAPPVGQHRAEKFKHTNGEVKFDDERTT